MRLALRAWLCLAALLAYLPPALADESTAEHWAFRAPQRSDPPPVKNRRWVRNPIDRFILARLEKEGLAPSPEADRVTLIRRLSLDLIGLPPTLAEVDAFRRRQERPGLREGGRAAAGLAALRRALGPASGSTPPATPTATASRRTSRASSGSTATGSSTPSTATCPTTSSSSSRSPATCCPNATQDQIVATGFLRNSMINEEGGIDPEQFRMEAMFDRMDAIGKGILGLTIQCAQCHDHKFDPLTQAEYYRLFAFLNNCARGERRRLHARRADEAGRHLPADPRDRGRPEAPRARLARADGRLGSGRCATISRSGRSFGPQLDATGGREVFPAGRRLGPRRGLRPDEAHARVHRQDRSEDDHGGPAGSAQRPEPAAGRAGPVDQGAVRADRIPRRRRPGRQPGHRSEVKIIRATADVNPPVKELDAIFDDRSKRRRVTGPVEFAIDGKDETAWGIDVGPGRSNVPRKAVFVFEKPIAIPEGSGADVPADAEPRRLEQRRQPEQQPRPLPLLRRPTSRTPSPTRCRPTSAPSSPFRAEKRTPAQVEAVFSYWRTTVPEWKEANERIEELWKQHPAGASQLVLQAQRRAARDARAEARRLPQAGRRR